MNPSLPPPTIAEFNPPPRTLMGPGPSDVPARVLAALGRPTLGHLDPRFIAMMDELKALLRYVFQTENALTYPVSGPGSAGMETCFMNLVEAGETVIVAVNGVFGQRMVENVRRLGATAVIVEEEWGKPVAPEKVEAAFAAHPEARLLAFVHAETSTGARSDAETLAALARRHDALTVMDCVTSLAGIPVLIDAWGIDAAYAGSQKCLSCTPGLSPVTFSPRAVEKIKARKSSCTSWFQDLNLVMGYWSGEKRTYHHTAPVNPLYALHEALRIVAEEGLAAAWHRHTTLHQRLADGLVRLGLDFVVDQPWRLPQLNAVRVPVTVSDEAALRRRLLDEYGLEIGAGLGVFAGQVWRIGLMGHSARPANVALCLAALGEVLGR